MKTSKADFNRFKELKCGYMAVEEKEADYGEESEKGPSEENQL